MVSSLLDKTWIFVFGSSELKLWQNEKGIEIFYFLNAVSNAELQRSEKQMEGQGELVYSLLYSKGSSECPLALDFTSPGSCSSCDPRMN